MPNQDWWKSLDKNGQEGYLKEHPQSKLAKIAKNDQLKAKPEIPNTNVVDKNTKTYPSEGLPKEFKRYRVPVRKVFKTLTPEQKEGLRDVQNKMKNNEDLDDNDLNHLAAFGNKFNNDRKFGFGGAVEHFLKAKIGEFTATGGLSIAAGYALYNSPILVGAAAFAAGAAAVYSTIHWYKLIRGAIRATRGTNQITDPAVKHSIKHANLSSIKKYYQEASSLRLNYATS